MPVDASIPLGVKPPDQMQTLSSLIGVANGVQTYQANAIPLQERQAASQFLSSPSNYTDERGDIDGNKLTQGVMKVAPTTGASYVQGILTAQKMKTEATSALSKLSDENRTRIANTLSTIPPDAPPDVVHGTIDALDKQYEGRIRPLSVLAHTGYDHAVKLGVPAVSQFMQTMRHSVLPQETQQNIESGSLSGIPTAAGTQLVQTKVGTGTPQGGTVGQPLSPPNQFVQTPTGRIGVGNTATGAIAEPQSAASNQPPVNFPQGESKETWADLQAQRTAAQQAANTGPVMHDINQTIVREAGKGLNTGTLGTLTQKLASATGFTLDPNDKATDYNILGKMLERSALTAAQSQGPHTNAGLEASVRANGSLDYTPAAIKKIAYLNDALVTGSELYRSGLEKAVQGDPNGVFAKRSFDQQWSKVATPTVLRLKNAVDNGNQEEVQSIIKEVGGKGSAGAKQLHDRLTQMLQLSGQ